MNYQDVLRYCRGEEDLAAELCKKLNLAVPEVTLSENSPEFIEANKTFNHHDFVNETMRINKVAKTLSDKESVIDNCFWEPGEFPESFVHQVFLDALNLSSTFSEKFRLHDLAMRLDPEIDKQLVDWLEQNGTLDDWFHIYFGYIDCEDYTHAVHAKQRILILLQQEIDKNPA